MFNHTYKIAAEIIDTCCAETLLFFKIVIENNGGITNFKKILQQIAEGKKYPSSEFDVDEFIRIARKNGDLI
jgi:hypothetical protein